MGLEQVVEKLKMLKVFPKTVVENAEIFRDCPIVDAVGREMARRHYTCSEGQFIYFHLHALMEKDPGFKARFLVEAVKKLRDSAIQPIHIDEYFQSGEDPGLVFTLKYEREYDRDARLAFYQRANQFALYKMREWLGIQ